MDISALRDRAPSREMTVSELNEFIKNIFDNNRVLSSVTVKGEISNFTNHRSGHFYFSLKDGESQIKCVMFRSAASRIRFLPENGMRIIAHGSVSVYTRDGGYQLYVNSMQPDGIGALYLAYEQLKAKLDAEGLFSSEYKKEIPRFPKSIGVITSPTGAAVRDIINVTGRRYPTAKIYIYPSLVQGDGAEENLIKALDYFDRSGLADTVIIGRGGGSIEDLWAFNGERLARKIFEMKTPVISAVGHETDFTICDFVSDLRAPTPSAAAELAVPDTREILSYLADVSYTLESALIHSAERKREKLETLREKIISLSSSPYSEERRNLALLYDRAEFNIGLILKEKLSVMKLVAEKLQALSPVAVLSRGYALAEKDGAVVRSVKYLNNGDMINVLFPDGELTAEINEIRGRKNEQKN